MEYKIVKYLTGAFVLAWIFQIIGSVLAINGIAVGFTIACSICMFAPMAAVLIVCKGLNYKKSGIEWKIKWKGYLPVWLAAWFGIIICCILGSAIFYLLFPNSFDPTVSEYFKYKMGKEIYAQSYGQMSTGMVFLVSISSVLGGSFINGIFALGEETGWRGYLYPALKEKFGKNLGRLYGGLIWGVWHWPVILLAGYEYGWSVFNGPLWKAMVSALLFCAITITIGTIFDELYEKSHCIWVPALAHGSFNAAAGIGICAIMPEYIDRQWFGPTAIGIISAMPLFAWMILIFVKSKIKKEKL